MAIRPAREENSYALADLGSGGRIDSSAWGEVVRDDEVKFVVLAYWLVLLSIGVWLAKL
jgi:hypothetical protein